MRGFSIVWQPPQKGGGKQVTKIEKQNIRFYLPTLSSNIHRRYVRLPATKPLYPLPSLKLRARPRKEHVIFQALIFSGELLFFRDGNLTKDLNIFGFIPHKTDICSSATFIQAFHGSLASLEQTKPMFLHLSRENSVALSLPRIHFYMMRSQWKQHNLRDMIWVLRHIFIMYYKQ